MMRSLLEMWFLRLFSKKWITITLLVIMASAVMVRLGFWQLDRLDSRRAFNRQVLEMRSLPQLDVNQAGELDLTSQIYRQAVVEGVYDFDYQVVLGNQVFGGRLGVHLLTPLRVESSDRVLLIDRGWVPYEDYLNNQLNRYNTSGISKANGILSGSQDRVGIRDCLESRPEPDKAPLVWCVDLQAIQQFMPYPLEEVYLLRAPETVDEPPPVGSIVQIETNEGMHLSYAVQWFSFATLLFFGYPIFMYREMKARQKREADLDEHFEGDLSDLEAAQQG